MIQLANDPNASRTSWRPAANDEKGHAEAKRARPGHAWPFLSPQADRPVRQERAPHTNSDSGS